MRPVPIPAVRGAAAWHRLTYLAGDLPSTSRRAKAGDLELEKQRENENRWK